MLTKLLNPPEQNRQICYWQDDVTALCDHDAGGSLDMTRNDQQEARPLSGSNQT